MNQGETFDFIFETKRNGFRGAPNSQPNFLYFHAVFGNIWSNNSLRPLPPWGWHPWEMLDPLLPVVN